ncbi:MAG: hypothetical protein V2J24_12780 [Pseudomonadales bacterium]|nr:hypothetical protein [Pseudomonadales bacterium]
MSLLERWIADGTIVTVVMFVLLVEIVVLGLRRLRTGRGLPLPQLLANAAAGGSIALALRSALVGEGVFMIGFWLVVGGIAHGTDLTLRLLRAD